MIQFTFTGPNGNHGGESRFPPSCNHGRSGGHTTKLFKKKKKRDGTLCSQAKNPVIEIPTVKWKEGGLLVARPSRGLPPRDQLSIGN